MTAFFFDTSALVKRYYSEKGTGAVDEIIETDQNRVVISSLSIIETVSAFRRKHNRSELSEEAMNGLLSSFFQEALEEFLILPLEESILQFSFKLILEDDVFFHQSFIEKDLEEGDEVEFKIEEDDRAAGH